MTRPTALVIGAGPAGLSAGIGLRRRGMDVVIVDQRAECGPRVCGSFYNEEAVRHLDWLRVRSRCEQKAVSLSQITLTMGQQRPIRLSTPTAHRPMAWSRMSLEETLIDQFESEGGRIQWKTRIDEQEEIRRGHTLILHAEGKFSRMPPTAPSADGWYGWNALFTAPLPPELSMFFYPGGYVGIVPVSHDGFVNVCGLTYKKAKEAHSPAVLFEEAKLRSHAFQKATESLETKSGWRGVPPLPFETKQRSHQNIFYVGDAAAVGDPFMGEGNARALSAGPMLFNAWRENDSVDKINERYRRLWQRAFASRLWLARQIRRGLASKTFFHFIDGKGIPFRHRLFQYLLPFFHRGYRYEKSQ